MKPVLCQSVLFMKLSRRTFLGTTMLGISAAAMSTVPTISAEKQSVVVPTRGYVRGDSIVLPPSLSKGSTIGITAPASGVQTSELEDGIRFLKDQGLKVVLGKCLSPELRYLSAPDNQRADELNEFVQRDDIDGILCARGGYGVARILPLIDYDSIRAKAKVIMGYSDITALLIAVYNKSKVVSYHGPVCSSTFDATTKSSFVQVMMTNKTLEGQDQTPEQLLYKHEGLEVFHEGQAEASMVGGNLSTICSTLGTPYEIDTRNRILFLEEIAEEPYRVDRMLTQLWLSGKFDDVKGVVLGVFKSCDTIKRNRRKNISPNDLMSQSLKQVFTQRFSTMTIPVLSGLPFGHIKSKLTLPLGVRARLDCADKSLRLLDPSVA